MKLYVAGPITGRQNRNRDEFDRVQAILESVGHDARIPHQFGEPHYSAGRTEKPRGTACSGLPWFPHSEADVFNGRVDYDRVWKDWMWFDLHALAAWRPEGVVLLSDWQTSKGAFLEHALFAGLGLRVLVNKGLTFFEEEGDRTFVFLANPRTFHQTGGTSDLEFVTPDRRRP